MFDKKQLNDDDVPRLYNYEGNKFSVREIMGEFEWDKNGNPIINDQDLKKRRVNKKGYLVDEKGNVVNKEGKKIFDVSQLNPDGEIPKILPFSKFNIYEISGDLEKNVDGKPILNYNNKKQTVD